MIGRAPGAAANGEAPLNAPDTHAVQLAAYRRMGGRGRTSVMFRLNELTRQLALSGIRRRHPEYTEAEAIRALRRLMLGDELTRAVWPEHPLVDP